MPLDTLHIFRPCPVRLARESHLRHVAHQPHHSRRRIARPIVVLQLRRQVALRLHRVAQRIQHQLAALRLAHRIADDRTRGRIGHHVQVQVAVQLAALAVVHLHRRPVDRPYIVRRRHLPAPRLRHDIVHRLHLTMARRIPQRPHVGPPQVVLYRSHRQARLVQQGSDLRVVPLAHLLEGQLRRVLAVQPHQHTTHLGVDLLPVVVLVAPVDQPPVTLLHEALALIFQPPRVGRQRVRVAIHRLLRPYHCLVPKARHPTATRAARLLHIPVRAQQGADHACVIYVFPLLIRL